MARKIGTVHSKMRTDAHKDAQILSRVENLLQNHIDGKNELSPTQLKAAELLYARLRPTLSAVEQHLSDDRDKLTEQELILQAQALISANPGLLRSLVLLLPVEQRSEILVALQQSVQASPQRSAPITQSACESCVTH